MGRLWFFAVHFALVLATGQGLTTALRVITLDKEIRGYTVYTERPVQVELLRLVATGKSAAVLGASMTDTDMITR